MECFVHQLKGNFENDSLKPFGQLKVKAISSTSVSMWLESTVRQTIKILSDNGSVIDTRVLEPNVRATISASTSTYVIYVIEDMFNLTAFYGHNTTGLGAGTDAKYEFDLRDLDYSNIPGVAPEGALLLTNSENYDEPIHLPNLTTLAASYKNAVENIGYIGGLTAMESKTFQESNPTIVEGEWTEVFANQCINGRVSGTFTINMYKQENVNHSTFNGINIYGTVFSASFNANGCTITPGINFTMRTGYTSATYNKATNVWSYES